MQYNCVGSSSPNPEEYIFLTGETVEHSNFQWSAKNAPINMVEVRTELYVINQNLIKINFCEFINFFLLHIKRHIKINKFWGAFKAAFCLWTSGHWNFASKSINLNKTIFVSKYCFILKASERLSDLISLFAFFESILSCFWKNKIKWWEETSQAFLLHVVMVVVVGCESWHMSILESPGGAYQGYSSLLSQLRCTGKGKQADVKSESFQLMLARTIVKLNVFFEQRMFIKFNSISR